MRNAIAGIVLAGLVAIIPAGCVGSGGGSGFSTKVAQLPAGTTKNDVLKTLGKPDARHSVVAGTPTTGPQPPAAVPAGSRYEDWVYHRDQTDYHVFLGQSAANPGQWEVLSVSNNPPPKP